MRQAAAEAADRLDCPRQRFGPRGRGGAIARAGGTLRAGTANLDARIRVVHPALRTAVNHQGRPGVGGIRAAAVTACLGLVATGVKVLVMPAAISGRLAGISGVRRVGDDLDAASRQPWVALLASVLLALGTVMSGSGALAATDVVTVAMLALARRKL